jgi:hypothetical protein
MAREEAYGVGRDRGEESVDTMLRCWDGREQMSVNILYCVHLNPLSPAVFVRLYCHHDLTESLSGVSLPRDS